MAGEDVQTTDISTPATPAAPTTPDAAAGSSNDAAPTTPADTPPAEGADDENSYLQELIAADDDDLETGAPPAEPEGVAGQAPKSEPVEGAPTPDATPVASEDQQTQPQAQPNASQEGQQPPASEAAPEATPQAQQQPQAQPPEGAPQTPEEFNKRFAEFFEQRVDTLAQSVYALDDATKEALDTEPSKIIPQLAGRLHMQVLTTALNQVAQMMPTILAEHTASTQSNTEAENAFYGQWPQLKEHKQVVENTARAYMQANPGVDKEVAIKNIGTIAAVHLGLPLEQTPPTAPQPPAQQQPPAQPVGLTPPVPSSSGGNGAPPSTPGQQPQNSWLEDLVNFED